MTGVQTCALPICKECGRTASKPCPSAKSLKIITNDRTILTKIDKKVFVFSRTKSREAVAAAVEVLGAAAEVVAVAEEGPAASAGAEEGPAASARAEEVATAEEGLTASAGVVEVAAAEEEPAASAGAVERAVEGSAVGGGGSETTPSATTGSAGRL